MDRRARWGLTFALTVAALSASAYAQAAGESVLLNSSSAAATAKAGKAFKAASDRVSKQLAGRVERQTSPPAQKTTTVTTHPASASAAPGTAERKGASSSSGPMIASIQGAQATCAPKDETGSTPESKSASESAQTDCNARKPARQERPSVITLSFSK